MICNPAPMAAIYPDIQPRDRFRPSATVRAQGSADGGLLVHVTTGLCFHLNPVGAVDCRDRVDRRDRRASVGGLSEHAARGDFPSTVKFSGGSVDSLRDPFC